MPYHNKSSLSQNFLKDRDIVRQLIDASDLNVTDTIIEIGPGRGIITTLLCGKVRQVLAIEKDPDLAEKLIKRTENITNLQIVNQDFLDYQLPLTNYKIFANPPFSITAEILNKVLLSTNLPDSMFLIMQLETAEKFIGNKFESQSSILFKPFFEIENLGDIDRTGFTLKPQVKIVFVKFKKRESPFIKDQDKLDFYNFVVYGFNQWQPTVLDAYKKVLTYTQLQNIKKSLKIGNVPPSELSFDKWLLFFKTYLKIATDDQKNIVKQVSR
ncbi:MAG: rRNA adenine dimethyltransferase family protein [Candidatus Shapirobacteria bacterium]